MKRPNGAGSVYKLPNGKYRAEVTLGYDMKGQRIKKTKNFPKKKDALNFLPELKNQTTTDITLKSLYDEWSKAHYPKVSKDMENGYKAAFSHCIGLYNRKVSTIKYQELQSIVDLCPHGRRTKADIKSVLSNMYKYGMKQEYTQKNLAMLIELPPKEKSKNEAFTKEEIKQLWEDYKTHDFTGYILIMCYTGMRYGEISIIEKINIYLDRQLMIGGIKTEEGIDREIPIANIILPIVAKFYNKNTKKLLEIHEKVFYNNFYETLERCGIRKLKPHCCRHTFFTNMALAKVQPAIISKTGGHKDYSTTMIYTNSIPFESKLEAVNSLE